jgi:penicillin amidase
LHDTVIRRVVRSVNILIAITATIAGIAVYWFALRPLPERTGTIPVPVDGPVSVAFDARGVPHIRAASLDDALFVQGYITAQDRLWQMDALRRYDAGELSEVLGPALLDTDRESRRLRLRRVAENAYTTLRPGDRAALAAYTRGVNEFINTHLDRLPVEFALLGYQPRPWSVVDSLLVCLHMFRTLTNTWRNEIAKAAMRASGDAAKVEMLFPVIGSADLQPGSNAWAIAGSHTASGKPLLSNDMHLDYSLPGIWYMAHLQAPGLDVSGVTLPGTAGVIVGHNQRIAWGITNLQVDVQDLYVERIDENTGQYAYAGHVEQARLEREIIRIKGQPAVELPVWTTRHGPLTYFEGKSRMAMRWSVAETGLLQYPILDIDRAGNWTEFTAALARFPGPGSNFIYADVDGNIGYHAAGKLPIRRGYRGDVPVDGSSDAYDWSGFIPFEELPSVFNPPGGLLVSANQNPFPPDYRYPINANFAPPHRFRQIRHLLRARNGWRAGDLLAVQKDVYSSLHDFLARQMVAAYGRRGGHNEQLDAAIASLKSWNGQMEEKLAAPLVAQLLYLEVRHAVAESASPSKGATYEFSMAPDVVERLLRARPEGWFRDWDDMLVSALGRALEEGRRLQGRNVNKWRYGLYTQVTVTHPVIHQVPWFGKYFDVGPAGMSGSSTTVRQTTRTLAPSMRMNADLGDWERSLLNVQIGQSGQIFSSHYRDEWKDYYYARSYPMEFGKVSAERTVEFRPTNRQP